MLAEDDASMRRLIEVLLSRAGYEVICVQDGFEAMQILESQEVDCVVTDAIMPNLSGFDLCRIVRAKNASLPCIILTGLDKVQDSQTEEKFFDTFVLKNENLKNSLITAIEQVLSAKRQ